MPILQQIREYIALSLQTFFGVPWQAVVAILVVIAAMCGVGYLRLHGQYGTPQEMVVCSVGLIAAILMRHYLMR